MKRLFIISVLSCFLLTFLCLSSFAESSQPYVNGLFQGETEYYYRLEPVSNYPNYTFVIFSEEEATHLFIDGIPASDVGFTSSGHVYVSLVGGFNLTYDSSITWGVNHSFNLGRYNESTGSGSSDTTKIFPRLERSGDGAVTQGLTSSISWIGEVLEFIVDNLLPIVGLSVGLGVVGFGISKIIGLLNEV